MIRMLVCIFPGLVELVLESCGVRRAVVREDTVV